MKMIRSANASASASATKTTTKSPSVVLLLWISAIMTCEMASPSEGAVAQWCVADPQAESGTLQAALDWACGEGRADCEAIQPDKPCFFPATLTAHASVAFNSYWQKFKKQGASCYFNAAALVTENDPSHDSCVFSFTDGSGISNGSFDNGPNFGSSPDPIANGSSELGFRCAFVMCLLLTVPWLFFSR